MKRLETVLFYVLLAFSLLIILATAGWAQPCTPTTTLAVNPTTVEAELPDHTATVLGSTTPLVSSYELRYYAEGAPSPFQTLSLPKADWTLISGNCYSARPSMFPLTLGIRYRAVLVAMGPAGNSAPSNETNPFGWPRLPIVGVAKVVP